MWTTFGAILHFSECRYLWNQKRYQETVNSLLSSFACTIISENKNFHFISTLIPKPYTLNLTYGESVTHNWSPQLVLLHYFAIKVMFKAFYWKHFSIILYGKSQTVLIISWGECMSQMNFRKSKMQDEFLENICLDSWSLTTFPKGWKVGTRPFKR